MPTAAILEHARERLREIGAWLARNGDSIYGTRGGPFLPGAYGVSTHRENVIYVHVLEWPGKKVVLPALPGKVVRASVFPNGREVSVTTTATTFEFSAPEAQRDAIDTIVKLEFDRSAAGLTPMAVSEKTAR